MKFKQDVFSVVVGMNRIESRKGERFEVCGKIFFIHLRQLQKKWWVVTDPITGCVVTSEITKKKAVEETQKIYKNLTPAHQEKIKETIEILIENGIHVPVNEV